MESVDVGIPGRLFAVTSSASAAAVSASYSSVASATASGIATTKLAVTHFSGCSAASASYTIESPAGTILWQKANTVAAFNQISENFDPPLMIQVKGQAVLFKAGGVAGTSSVNGLGYEVESG